MLARSRAHSALVNWVVDQRPVTMWTLGFHHLAQTFVDPQASLAAIKRDTAKIVLAADQRLHGTRFVTERVPACNRIAGFCFPEKLAGAQHVHIAVLPLPQLRVEDFVIWQLKHLVTTPAKIEPHDCAILDRAGEVVDPAVSSQLVKSIAIKATSHVVSVTDPKPLAEYVTKEFEYAERSAFENFFLLSEFHSARQKRA